MVVHDKVIKALMCHFFHCFLKIMFILIFSFVIFVISSNLSIIIFITTTAAAIIQDYLLLP